MPRNYKFLMRKCNLLFFFTTNSHKRMQLRQFIRRTDKSLPKQLKLTMCEVLNGSQGYFLKHSGEHFIIIHFSTYFNQTAVAQGESFSIKHSVVFL